MSASPRSLAVAAIVGLAGCCDAARPPHRGLVQGAVDVASREPGTGPTTSEERACRVRGSLLTLAGEEVVLCDRPNRRCFGRISGNRTSSNILSLVLSSAEHARLALVAQGVVVEASVAVDALALHPSGPFPIEGYFLSTKSQVEVLKVRGDTVEIGVPSGRELRPLEPLRGALALRAAVDRAPVNRLGRRRRGLPPGRAADHPREHDLPPRGARDAARTLAPEQLEGCTW